MNKFLVKHPIIAEKSSNLAKFGKYVFLIDKKASASEAKKIVENIYNVKIANTHVINIKSKRCALGRTVGVKPGYKKIIMTLQKGQKLDIIPQ
jgi:large subunit ribosomal protein L23